MFPIPHACEEVLSCNESWRAYQTTRSLFEIRSEIPQNPEVEQEIQDRKGEAKRVMKRLAAIFKDVKDAAYPLKIKLGSASV